MESSGDEQNIIIYDNQTSDGAKVPLINSSRDYENNEAPVKDRFNLVFMIFYLLGIGCLLPWNFFSNAKRYFSYKLRNTTLNETSMDFDNPDVLTNDQILFLNYLEMAALLPVIFFTFFSIVITNLVSVSKRISCAVVVLFLLFLITTAMTHVNTDDWQKMFLYISLVTVVIMNAAVAILQTGLCGLAGKFPEKYMQSLMGGMGLGGLFAAISSLVITTLSTHPMTSGLVYFITATGTVFICFIGFLLLSRIKFASYYLNQPRFDKSNQDYIDIVVNSLTASNTKCSACRDIFVVFKKIWIYAISMCLTFIITLTCYPALISAVRSTSENKTWADVYFSPIGCFVVFNLFDVVGRVTVSILRWPSDKNPSFLLVVSILRLAFIPAFFFCNIQPRNFSSPFFTSDWIPILLNVFLGWSNGHLATLCMMYAPRAVENHQVEMSGSIMPFFLASGLGFGSLLSMLFMWKFI